MRCAIQPGKPVAVARPKDESAEAKDDSVDGKAGTPAGGNGEKR